MGSRVIVLFSREKRLYTEHICIPSIFRSKSRPSRTVTLNTRYPDDPQALLATYIHEQIHWFVLLVGKAQEAYAAMEMFRQMYPDLPVDFPDGCHNEQSNYLHIAVNYLEYMGLIDLFGNEVARQVIERKDYYKRIYEIILHETEKVEEVMEHHGLMLPERPPELREFIQPGA